MVVAFQLRMTGWRFQDVGLRQRGIVVRYDTTQIFHSDDGMDDDQRNRVMPGERRIRRATQTRCIGRAGPAPDRRQT